MPKPAFSGRRHATLKMAKVLRKKGLRPQRYYHVMSMNRPIFSGTGRFAWATTAAGWTGSLLIHLLAAVVFFMVSPEIVLPDRPHQPPRTTIEQHVELLKVEPIVENLKIEPINTELLELSPDHAELPDTKDKPRFSQPQPGVIAVSTDDGGNRRSRTVFGRPVPSSFCGTSGLADRICFVVDTSGSMITAHDYVRDELKRTVKTLSPAQYFHIIFFADGTPIEMTLGQLVRASAGKRQKALPFIEKVGLISVSTDEAAAKAVANAMRAAFRARTFDNQPAQLIYLFTDGEFEHDKVNKTIEILQASCSRHVTINVIACGNNDNKPFLKALAKKNLGQFRFVSDEEMAKKR